MVLLDVRYIKDRVPQLAARISLSLRIIPCSLSNEGADRLQDCEVPSGTFGPLLSTTRSISFKLVLSPPSGRRSPLRARQPSTDERRRRDQAQKIRQTVRLTKVRETLAQTTELVVRMIIMDASEWLAYNKAYWMVFDMKDRDLV